ncbi:MAG TPA: flagellin [Sphingomonas sp.]|jgi:flagellar hook-associated protein 3 FlgL
MRVATIPFQQTMRSALQKSQQALVTTQQRLATGKQVNDIAGLGTDAVRTLSTRSLLAAQEGQAKTARQIGNTLALYDANIGQVDTAATDLRTSLITAIGNGKAAGLQQTAEAAFAQVRSALNSNSEGKALFGGSQVDSPPFLPATLAATAGMTPASAFANDDVRGSARVGDNIDVTYGVTASELGAGMLAVFRTLAEAGPISEIPTPAQLAAMQAAVDQIDAAVPQIRTVNSINGARQAQVETLAGRADDRKALLDSIITQNEGVDWGQLSIDLETQKQLLDVSSSVFVQITRMSLANYLN